MSSTRSIISAPPFAENALTVIPPTPIAGVSYRDPSAGPASSPDGWPYAERVNSAEFNQIMFQGTTLLSLIDKKGLLGWSDLVDYTEAALCFGSDGLVYEWISASGPANGGAKDPISSPTFWRLSFQGRLLNVQRFTASGTYTPTPGTRSVVVEVQGGGGAGGGAAATAAGQVAAGGGGGGGGRAWGRLTSGFSGASVLVGIGGVPSPAGAVAGGSGGASSFGGSIAATGGTGGQGAIAAMPPNLTTGGAGGQGSGGSLSNPSGEFGGCSQCLSTANAVSGTGGMSWHGGGGFPRGAGAPGVGIAAGSLGAGGSGGLTLPSSAAVAGGAGGPGIVIVWEYT